MLLGPCSTRLKTVFNVLCANIIRLTSFQHNFKTLGGENSPKIAKTRLYCKETTQNKRGIAFFTYFEPLDTILGSLDYFKKISWEKGTQECNKTSQGVQKSSIMTQNHNFGLKMMRQSPSTHFYINFSVLGPPDMSLAP